MTQAEEILKAVMTLNDEESENLSAKVIRLHLGLSNEVWQATYNKTFLAMRVNPTTSYKVGTKYRNVFQKIYHGCYCLTDEGHKLLLELKHS